MTKKIKKGINRNTEIEETLKRVQADFINFRNRVETEKKEFFSFASKELILKIIPILDNFERAFSHTPKELKDNEWISGIKQIQNQIKETLEREGVEKIETTGKDFDYTYHEAVGSNEDKDKKDGEVLQEVEAGYTLNGKLIKPAKVIVNTLRRKE